MTSLANSLRLCIVHNLYIGKDLESGPTLTNFAHCSRPKQRLETSTESSESWTDALFMGDSFTRKELALLD